MSELLFCPFCGGEAETIRNDIGVFIGCFNADCPIGPATSTYVDGYATEAEAIAAWNSRAERTCEFNIKDNMNETEGMGDVWIECSACNCVFDFYADEWLMKMSYCPNCGARVVE